MIKHLFYHTSSYFEKDKWGENAEEYTLNNSNWNMSVFVPVVWNEGFSIGI